MQEEVDVYKRQLLNGDVIDGIMMEDKKEVDKVILTGAEPVSYTHLSTKIGRLDFCRISLHTWKPS